MVSRIEQYRMKNGKDILKVILKPTKVFPNGGYFYAPVEAISLVESLNWCLSKSGNRVVVTAGTHNSLGRFTYYFHQELCNFYLGYYVDYIDHINHIETDNVDQNLNIVTSQQNGLNKLTKGYQIRNENYSKLAFRPMIVLNGQTYFPFSQVHREDEACVLQYQVEAEILRDMMGDEFYQFDFKRYRRGDLDILDLERTGKISEEEATYKHILKYSDNAWYYLRYGLQDYFRENKIPIPQYSLDSDGFMINLITNKRLCPFEYKAKY